MEPANEEKEKGDAVGIVTTTNGEEENDKAVPEVKDQKDEDEDDRHVSSSASPPQQQQQPPAPKSLLQNIIAFYWEYQMLIHILMAIGLARLYPRLGVDFLAPQITATWLAVMIMFCTLKLPSFLT
jgi:hypothetical protein